MIIKIFYSLVTIKSIFELIDEDNYFGALAIGVMLFGLWNWI